MPKETRKRIRRRVLVALLIVVCVMGGWYGVNRALRSRNALRTFEAEGARSASPRFVGRLRIATYNIAHGRGTAQSNWQITTKQAHLQRLKQIARLLKTERPDLVVLNEVDFDALWTCGINHAETIAREGAFPFRVEHRHFDVAGPFVCFRFGNAVLSRYPVSDVREVDFPGLSSFESIFAGRKRGLLCRISLSDEQSVRLLAVHLEHRSESVRTRCARIIERVRRESDEPVIVAGDFNSTPVNFPCATPDADGRTAMSVLLATGRWRTLPTSAPAPAEFTFSTTKPRSVIDWILIPPNCKILSKKVAGGQLSDHYAVIMEAEFGESARP